MIFVNVCTEEPFVQSCFVLHITNTNVVHLDAFANVVHLDAFANVVHLDAFDNVVHLGAFDNVKWPGHV